MGFMADTRVIFLHGAPAVGKLTVANALATLTPVALVDNHVLIDFAKSVLEFGAPGFFDLVRESRILAIRHAVRRNVPLVLITSCYSEPEDRPQPRVSASHGYSDFVYCHQATEFRA